MKTILALSVLLSMTACELTETKRSKTDHDENNKVVNKIELMKANIVHLNSIQEDLLNNHGIDLNITNSSSLDQVYALADMNYSQCVEAKQVLQEYSDHGTKVLEDSEDPRILLKTRGEIVDQVESAKALIRDGECINEEVAIEPQISILDQIKILESNLSNDGDYIFLINTEEEIPSALIRKDGKQDFEGYSAAIEALKEFIIEAKKLTSDNSQKNPSLEFKIVLAENALSLIDEVIVKKEIIYLINGLEELLPMAIDMNSTEEEVQKVRSALQRVLKAEALLLSEKFITEDEYELLSIVASVAELKVGLESKLIGR